MRIPTTPEVRERLENQVRTDFALVRGRAILVFAIEGYAHNGDKIELDFERPILVRVVDGQDRDLLRWLDDWIDPVWNLIPLEQRPEMADGHGWEMYGTSYCADDRADRATYEIVPWYRVLIRRLARAT